MVALKCSSSILMLMAVLFHTAVDASDLKIHSMRIYFSNDRPEITVQRNYPLKAYAEIGYTGVGVLQGRWEADDEFLAGVTTTIPAENRVVIESPDIPKIPTFVSGGHKVKLIIVNPPLKIPFPSATYYVTTDEWRSGEEKKH